MIAWLLFSAAVALAYANGSNDNIKAVATLHASDTLSFRHALRLATAAQVLGSLASIALAAKLVTAFSGKGLVSTAVLEDPRFLLAVAIGGAATVILASFVGMPVSTTHALVGALLGGGLALAPSGVSWGNLGSAYAAPLLISPLIAVSVTTLLYPLARRVCRQSGWVEESCVCVDVGSPDTTLMQAAGGHAAAAQAPLVAICHASDEPRSGAMTLTAARAVDLAHTVSAFALGFARGLNDTPKIAALILGSVALGIHPPIALAIIASAMAIGGVLGSRRVGQTLCRRITRMNRGQGLLTNLVASVLVIGASLHGQPVSTTHVSTGAIFGIGAWTGQTDWKVVGHILGAWLITLPIAALGAYLVAST